MSGQWPWRNDFSSLEKKVPNGSIRLRHVAHIRDPEPGGPRDKDARCSELRLCPRNSIGWSSGVDLQLTEGVLLCTCGHDIKPLPNTIVFRLMEAICLKKATLDKGQNLGKY